MGDPKLREQQNQKSPNVQRNFELQYHIQQRDAGAECDSADWYWMPRQSRDEREA